MAEPTQMQIGVMVAWCNMKLEECDQQVETAKAVGVEKLAEPFARDGRFYRAIGAALETLLAKAVDDQ